jgi:hypothetical protein
VIGPSPASFTMTVQSLPIRLLVNEREYSLIQQVLSQHLGTSIKPEAYDLQNERALVGDHTVAAFRSATRVSVVTYSSLKALAAILDRIAARKSATATRSRKPLVASHSRMALSLGSLLFFHAVLYRIFARLRLQLLHEKVQSIRQRYPGYYAVLTSKAMPAIGASLSGLAMGVNPADQLRVSIAIYIGCRALELVYAATANTKIMKSKPAWVGSWLIFALSWGQLFHAHVFDPDCAPEAYSSFVSGFTPEYLQPRPENIAAKVTWPSSQQLVGSLAQMARLKWPAFDSPILRPKTPDTLPSGVDHIITPITSRAHPAILHLSCALMHPTEPSCFMAYLRQVLLAFPMIAKFFTKYYGAFALLRIRSIIKNPFQGMNKLSETILRTSLAITGSISTSWGMICLFQAIFPRTFLPKFRFFLGGLLGGTSAIMDQTSSGHANALYAARTSVDSLWKVGVKRRWWQGVKNGDVLLFVASLAVVNVVYDLGRNTPAGRDRVMSLIRVLRGDVELGLSSESRHPATKDEEEDKVKVS